MENRDIQRTIEAAYAAAAAGDRATADSPAARAAVAESMARLDAGRLRVASKQDGVWEVHAWVKQAILLYFGHAQMQAWDAPPFAFYDKIPLKQGLQAQGVRLVPPGAIRYGAHVEPGCVVMPGYVNIGAYVGRGSMVDTWATVGSCAQIGEHVHLSGGVGIGGVLEPPQATPVIVEDHAFIGSRCIIVEGVIVRERAVIGAGVTLTASTPIIDVSGEQETVRRGEVPAGSVVIPGSRPKSFAAGSYHVPCALIVGQRSASTDMKTSLNDTLRRFELPG